MRPEPVSQFSKMDASQKELEVLADFIRRTFGVELSASKRSRLAERLQVKVAKAGLGSLSAYVEQVSARANADELAEIAEVVTTNVTSFFREGHHFDALKTQVVPRLRKKVEQGHAVRIWSAGCSMGHEPYSIAMTLFSAWPQIFENDVKILATDIDRKALGVGEQGKYDAETVSSVPAEYRSFFTHGDAGYAVDPKLRKAITFRELNLLAAWPFSRQFDVIFCRNVAIYFGSELQEEIWARFRSSLTDDGYLFIGHSERVPNYQDIGLAPFGTTSYRVQSA